jgi:hypothetical protein
MRADARPYLDLEFFTTAYRLLTKAEKACGSNVNALLHVRHEWIPVNAAIYNMWHQLRRQLPKDGKMPFDRQAILLRLLRRSAKLPARKAPPIWYLVLGNRHTFHRPQHHRP